ncbi:MAG TPA: hypothetical protein VMQ56_12065 [Terracidiphilus sp.]|jgi:integrase|nr:hypothetical protein [Terracidiphilus sp.]
MAIPRTYATAGAFRRALEERLKSMSQTERWRLKLQKVFALAGGFQETPVPHRFRHTFVRILLGLGVPVGDVANLVGDTERVLLRYYANWILSPGTPFRHPEGSICKQAKAKIAWNGRQE